MSDDVLEEENAESYSEEDSETEIDEDGYVVYKAKKVMLKRLFFTDGFHSSFICQISISLNFPE